MTQRSKLNGSARVLRVAIVTPFPEDPDVVAGGVAGVARCLATELARRDDVEVIIVAPGPKRAVRQWRGCLVEFVPTPPLPGVLGYWTELRRRLLGVVDSWAPDVVHFQGMAAWSLGCRRPSVLTIHGIVENDTRRSGRAFPRARAVVMGQTERLGRRRASDVIVISPYVEQALGGQLLGKIWRIENPIDARFFDARRDETPKTVLFVGMINQRKNLRGLLTAFRRVLVDVPGARLRVVGDAPEPEYLEACRSYVESSDMENSINFLGKLGVERVEEELGRASCLVLPSLQETAPLAIAEALASGVPVVASGRFGIPHMVDHGETGLLCDPEDPNDIAQQLVRILQSDRLRASMSARGREVARQRFHPAMIAERTHAVYSSVCR